MKYDLNKINELKQKKNDLIEKMENIADKALEEKRAFNDDEKSEYEKYETEVRALADTIKKLETEYEKDIEHNKDKEEDRTTEKAEERAFITYIRGENIDEELRADSNFTLSDNGAVIPKRILNRIFEEAKERCNVWNDSEKFNIGGTLSLPMYDESDGTITMAYSDEFKKLTSTSGKFKSVDLKGFLAGALTKVSKSLLNNSDFDLFTYIVGKMGEAIADFLEKELIHGTEGKIAGLSDIDVVADSVTADNIITLQDSVKQTYQKNSKFIMNSKTKDKVRKLKDNNGQYYLVRDYSRDGSDYTLLGKPVELTDALGDDEIIYGDMTGLKTKVTENASIEILREKFADEHAIGVVAWVEADSKLIEKYKLKAIKPTAAEKTSSK